MPSLCGGGYFKKEKPRLYDTREKKPKKIEKLNN